MAFKRTTLNPFSVFLSAILMAGGNIASAGVLPDADYYVSGFGSDTTGDGSANSPWATSGKAATAMTALAPATEKVVYFIPGVYYGTAKNSLPINVSFLGSGVTTCKFVDTYTGDNGETFNCWFILYSATLNEQGNQSISNIWFDGAGLTKTRWGHIRGRGGVNIHHCKFTDFLNDGVTFNGQPGDTPSYEAYPAVYITGNKFNDNEVTNCSLYSGYGHGGLQYGAQNGFEALRNTIIQTARTTGQNGWCIKLYRGGHVKNCNISYNVLTRALIGETFRFCAEQWGLYGGCVWSYNTLQGSLDFNNGHKGASTYSVRIHHNNFNFPNPLTFNTMTTGIELESTSATGYDLNSAAFEDILIDHNLFRNVGYCCHHQLHTAASRIARVKFVNNKLWQAKIGSFGAYFTAATMDDFEWSGNSILNDRAVGNVAPNVGYDCIELTLVATATNFKIRSNIIQGGTRAAIVIWNGNTATGKVLDGLVVDGNIMWDNGSSNTMNKVHFLDVGSIAAVTNMTGSNGTTDNPVNPLYVGTASDGNMHLQIGSPAIGVGINIGLTDDYDGVARGTPPDVGAFEYV